MGSILLIINSAEISLLALGEHAAQFIALFFEPLILVPKKDRLLLTNLNSRMSGATHGVIFGSLKIIFRAIHGMSPKKMDT